ncbi:MAG: hypothetical protein K9N46_00465 [Candidatus Marinimicrobia bacterium]|nr:hypothetical protein [Candidatus Neomarinimicrobiota bacterium]MCF7828052.1 hypothetical protein [Candidatus Neomarinimicrobiota bacterium]MCF7879193.1 hypothetical protein [Candidatus Neomarinimicrobiota bacterium]
MTTGEAANLLETVIVDQREILRNHVNTDVTEIPQAFTLRINAINPGVSLDRIIVDFGGYVKSYGVIPETRVQRR